jgi:hypothetical protein
MERNSLQRHGNEFIIALEINKQIILKDRSRSVADQKREHVVTLVSTF